MSTLNRRTLPTVLAAMSARALVQDTEPVNPNIGAIWFDTTVGALKVWDGSTWNVAQIDTAGIADGAVGTDQISFVLSDIGGSRVTIGSSAPSSPATGDLWFDAGNGYVMKQWDGASWVPFQWDSGSVAPGSIDTSHVTFSARDLNGITTTFSTTAPGSPVTGDLWYDTDNGYRLSRWDGASWVNGLVGTDAIAAGAITAALIAANTITAAEIAAGAITASELAANSVTAAAIQAGTITATELAAGIIVAGIVDATTITGAELVVGDAGEPQLIVHTNPSTSEGLIEFDANDAMYPANGIMELRLNSPGSSSGQSMVMLTTPSGAAGGGTDPEEASLKILSGSPDGTSAATQVIVTAASTQLLGTLETADDITIDSGGQLRLLTPGLSLGGTVDASDGTNLRITPSVAGGKVVINGPCDLVPAGSITMYGGASAPSGWLKCDGSSVLRSAYPDLFAVIGTTYGSVDGTHFTLPDFGSKFPRGNTPGTGGGADSHTHTSAAHTHSLTSGHALIGLGTGAIVVNQDTAGGGIGAPTHKATLARANASGADAITVSAKLDGNSGSTTPGDTGSSSNVPAYTGVTFIIKT